MTAKRAARLCLALSVALILGLGAGCGDDGGSDPTAEDPGAQGEERSGSGDGESGDAADNASRRVLEACREVVERAPGLSEGVKADLIAECEAAATDDEEAARRAADAACEAIAAATVPGPLRAPAAAACRRAIPDPASL